MQLYSVYLALAHIMAQGFQTTMKIFAIVFIMIFLDQTRANEQNNVIEDVIPCTCGVFLTGQFKKGSKEQPKGMPVITQEIDGNFLNNSIGSRHCINKCLEAIIKHLPKSSDIICAGIERDCYKERAYLFVQNNNSTWINSNMSAGREYCCKDNTPYKCPTTR